MPVGRLMIVSGLLLVVVGLAISYGRRLPGDIAIHGKNFSFYFPIATCILLSVILSLVMWLMKR